MAGIIKHLKMEKLFWITQVDHMYPHKNVDRK